jgi:hypothetical protein
LSFSLIVQRQKAGMDGFPPHFIFVVVTMSMAAGVNKNGLNIPSGFNSANQDNYLQN